MKTLLLIAACFLLQMKADAQVSISLQQPPPFRFNISSLWNVTLVNSSGGNLNVYLHGQAVKMSEGLVVEANTSFFVLQPGVKMVNASEIQPIDVKEANQTYKDIIRSTGTVPAGDYEICVSVVNADNGDVLGTDCIVHSVQNFSQVELITPMEGTDVIEMYPVFTWLPPTPVTSGAMLNYTLSIYEVLGRQTPYNAVQSNRAFFEFPDISSTVFRYPAASRGFVPGRRYAVQVTAYIGDVLISESDVNDFRFIGNVFSKTEDDGMMYGEDLNLFAPQNLTENSYNNSYPTFDRKRSILAASKFIEEKKSDFRAGLKSGIELETSDRTGTYSQLKKDFGRFDITPYFSFHDIPFGFNFFVATDNSEDKQNMNSFTFDFDPGNLKSIIQNKVEDKLNSMREDIERKIMEQGEKSRDKIESQAKDNILRQLSFPMKLFSAFQSLGIGMSYPQYTDYTVSGVQVTGLNLEFNPGLFYGAVTGAVNNKAIENKTFKRNLYAGRLGVGKKDNSHLFFTMMFAKDDKHSITVNPNNTSLTPKSNHLIGTEGQLNLFDDKLKLQGEIGVSFLTDDLNAPDMIDDGIPEWIRNMLSPKLSSRVDGFYKIETSFDNVESNTTLKAGVLMVGPGYLSLGSPTKRGDKLEYQFSASQRLLDNKLTARVSFKTGRDNLLEGFKNFTTRSSLLNLGLTLRVKDYPSLTVNYFPVFLSNNATADADILDNVNHNLMVITTYPFKFSDINNATSLMFSWNAANTHRSLNDTWNWNMNLSNVMSFNNPLFISGSFGMMKFGGLNEFSTYTADISTGYTFFDTWQNVLGFNLTSSPDQNRNLLFYLNSSNRIEELITLDLRLEKNIYDDDLDSNLNFDDLVMKFSVKVDWK